MILRQAEVPIEYTDQGILVKRQLISSIDADLTDSPDLWPILSIVAGGGKGKSRLGGLIRLQNKESNRGVSIKEMLVQLGVEYEQFHHNELNIIGRGMFEGGVTIEGAHDHRIVMAASIAALKASGPITITNAEAVEKSYPLFFQDAAELGMKMSGPYYEHIRERVQS
jgi:3-phosphoshikimate 1-carboxyvinyltransferase